MITVRNNLCHGRPSVTFTFQVDINPAVVEAAATDETLRDDIVNKCLNQYRNELYVFLKEGPANE